MQERTVDVINGVALKSAVGSLEDRPHDGIDLLLEEGERVENLKDLVVKLCNESDRQQRP